MRFTRILSLAAVAVFASATASSAAPSAPDATVNAIVAPTSLVISAVQDPQPQTQVKVDLDTDRDTVWYTDPVWLAVGAIALLVIIVLAVMAARGGDRGGTTVVR
jgi:hypothetical protein